MEKEWRLQGSPHVLIFPTSQPKTETVMFQATHKISDWLITFKLKWKGWLLSKQCSNCMSWSLEQGQPRPTANDSSIHSKPLGGIFVLVLNYCPPASDKTRSKPNDVPWHLSASLSMTFSIFSVFFQDPKNLSQCLPIFSCFPSMCGRSLDF